jgi:putative CocE/NonD family hydrolase
VGVGVYVKTTHMPPKEITMLGTSILSICSVLLATPESDELGVIYERNVPAKMRDGVILRADVYRPNRGGPYPVLVTRTRIGKAMHRGSAEGFANAGYIVVCQDIRGGGESEGKWESWLRFRKHDAEDGYDTVEWAAELPGSNGKVGTFGVSALAHQQWRLAPLRPPSLTAMAAGGCFARRADVEPTGTIRPAILIGA